MARLLKHSLPFKHPRRSSGGLVGLSGHVIYAKNFSCKLDFELFQNWNSLSFWLYIPHYNPLEGKKIGKRSKTFLKSLIEEKA